MSADLVRLGVCPVSVRFNSSRGTIMARKAPDIKGVRVFPPPPKGFDALAASKTDLARHGLPPRPDPRTQPGPAALWEKIARRYKDFDHLEPELLAPDKPTEPVAAGFGLPALVSCGFELGFSAPITILSGTWTVPDLNHSPTPEQFPNHLHTFFGLAGPRPGLGRGQRAYRRPSAWRKRDG
jgi:hypothetical protein